MAEEWKTVTVPLLHPIKVGELSLTEIVLKEPDLEALEKIDEAGFEEGVAPSVKQIRLAIEALSGQPTEVIRRLHKADYEKVASSVAPLLTGQSEPVVEPGSDVTTSTTLPATSAPS